MTVKQIVTPHISWVIEPGPSLTFSQSSPIFSYLSELFLDFEESFNQHIGFETATFTLSQEQILFLISGITEKFENLLESYQPFSPALNLVSIEYQGKTYELCPALSPLHRLMYTVFHFYELLCLAVDSSKNLICTGK